MHVVSLCHCLPPRRRRSSPARHHRASSHQVERRWSSRRYAGRTRNRTSGADQRWYWSWRPVGALIAPPGHSSLDDRARREDANSERIPEVIPCIPLENGPYRRDPNRVTALAANYFRGLCLNSRSHMSRHFIPSRCSARSTWTLSPSPEVIVGGELIARAAKVRRPCRWPSIIRPAVVAVWAPAIQLQTARWWTGSSTPRRYDAAQAIQSWCWAPPAASGASSSSWPPSSPSPDPAVAT
jgi:hypothetical protein